MSEEHKPKILLLDDESFLLYVYKTKFEESGFEVVCCKDVDTALQALRRGVDPDVILFDLTMPDDRSGYEFIESVHREKLAGHAITIALTNESRDGSIARVKELGADAHLLKAKYIPSELVEEIRKLQITKTVKQR